ncbi:MAG: prepilin-type N-terminal cleavage/methylation domain-containing protein [Sedimentisphaerales bacterium]|nr:prepilin-type N-terminal cleavage/methylation domain-containing protein [Sedimentisphaerales bacterium]
MKIYKGFTLIELLIVIAIIALLLTILAPALQVAKQQATGSVCLGNQYALIRAWLEYADISKDYIIGGDTIGTDWETGTIFGNRQHFDWVDYPQDEAGNYVQPANMTYEDRVRGIERGGLYKFLNRKLKAYHCPGDDRKFAGTGVAAGYRSYSVQGVLNGHDWWAEYAQMQPIRKLGTIKFPESKYVFVEESEKEQGHNHRSWALDPYGLVPIANGWWDPVAIFHNKKSTLSFTDGHAIMYNWQCEVVIEASMEGRKQFSCPDGAHCPDLVYMQQGVAHGGHL